MNTQVPETNPEQLVVFIDAYNMLYRAYHATTPLFSPDGTPTNVIFTQLKSLLHLQKVYKNNVRFGLAVFDGGGGSKFRKELYPEYKLTRSEMPEDLKVQIPIARELFEIMGWKTMLPINEEADDVIGTLACKSSKKFKTEILSSDKDFYPLVNENLVIVDGKAKKIYDREEVFNKIGLYPESITDYLALIGDSVDNVPGIDKCGEKTAVKLLQNFKSIEGIIENSASIKGVVGDNIREAIQNGNLLLYRELIKLRTDLDITVTVKDIRKDTINQQLLENFCIKYGFNSFLPPHLQNNSSNNSNSYKAKP